LLVLALNYARDTGVGSAKTRRKINDALQSAEADLEEHAQDPGNLVVKGAHYVPQSRLHAD